MLALGTTGYPPWPWSHLVISISHTASLAPVSHSPCSFWCLTESCYMAHLNLYSRSEKERRCRDRRCWKRLSILLLLLTQQELFIYLLFLLPWTWTSTHLSSGALWPTSTQKIRGSTNQDIMLIKVWCQFSIVQVFLTESSTTSVTKCILFCILRKCKCPIKLISLI